MSENNCTRFAGIESPGIYFALLCIIHLGIWTVVNIYTNYNAPLDVAEAIAWGREWQWGYDRDPYLVAWLAQIASLFANGGVWTIHLLGQICVVASFWAVWRLAQVLNFSKIESFISVLILEGVFYYHVTTGEFNDNVLQLPLWALTVYYYYNALTKQDLKDWMGVGAFFGLALMAKYFSVMLVVPMGLLLLTAQGRKSFKNIGFYAAALICLTIVLPNIIWLVKNNFQYITYAVNRSEIESHWINHFWHPVNFLGSQLIAIGPAILFYILSSKSNWQKFERKNFNTLFLLVLGIGPAMMVLMYSIFTGGHVRSMWGTPLWGLTGVLLVYFSRPLVDQGMLKKMFFTFGGFFSLCVVGTILSVIIPAHYLGYAKTVQYPSPDIAKYLTQVWHDNMDRPLKYVAGTRQIVARVAVYSKDHPRAYFNWNSEESPWIKDEDLLKNGAIFVWDADKKGEKLPANIRERFPTAKVLPKQTFSWHTGAPIKPVTIGVALLGE